MSEALEFVWRHLAASPLSWGAFIAALFAALMFGLSYLPEGAEKAVRYVYATAFCVTVATVGIAGFGAPIGPLGLILLVVGLVFVLCYLIKANRREREEDDNARIVDERRESQQQPRQPVQPTPVGYTRYPDKKKPHDDEGGVQL
jgi:Ca2+/Na+ antiporter